TVAARAADIGEEIGEAMAMPANSEAIETLLAGLRIIADRDVQRRYIERIVERAGAGLSPIAAWLLLRVERDGGVDPAGLARAHRMEETAVRAGLDELTARGLVDDSGARLTGTGCTVLDKLLDARRVRLEELAVDWPEDRRTE